MTMQIRCFGGLFFFCPECKRVSPRPLLLVSELTFQSNFFACLVITIHRRIDDFLIARNLPLSSVSQSTLIEPLDLPVRPSVRSADHLLVCLSSLESNQQKQQH